MKTIISSNDLFKIILVEDENIDGVHSSHYELIETPNTSGQTFESLSTAEQVMRQKTEFWKSIIRKLYFEVCFIA
ncbi:hypothetical protein [Cellvibrio mixtus]|uniref:hypothetical protein n=1 Tax=Cellvibrio mixtus TaxID=39650 RepID=UPI00058663D6|nr:hypothetical protein [Cellvibrio mixtus]